MYCHGKAQIICFIFLPLKECGNSYKEVRIKLIINETLRNSESEKSFQTKIPCLDLSYDVVVLLREIHFCTLKTSF